MDLQFVPQKPPEVKKKASKENTLEQLMRITGFDAHLCPFCKKGKMIIMKEIPRIRSPGYLFPWPAKAARL
jgi:hypothetical protein